MTEPSADRHVVEFTPMRQAIARRMVDSKRLAPHFYESVEIEMDGLLDALAERNLRRPPHARISVTAAIVRAIAILLEEQPAFNARWRGEVLERVDPRNIGVAIELPDGLIAPALLGCERLDLGETADGLRDLVARAKAGRIRSAEWADATFTLSNLGMFGIDAFTAIVVPPQVAILATARTKESPVVRDGTVVIRRVMVATLSADHRAVDGAAAARFLTSFDTLLRAPAGWMDSVRDRSESPIPRTPAGPRGAR